MRRSFPLPFPIRYLQPFGEDPEEARIFASVLRLSQDGRSVEIELENAAGVEIEWSWKLLPDGTSSENDPILCVTVHFLNPRTDIDDGATSLAAFWYGDGTFNGWEVEEAGSEDEDEGEGEDDVEDYQDDEKE